MATWSKPLALESAERLQALHPSRLAVGHGRVLEAPGEAIMQAIAVARQRFGKEIGGVADAANR
jgi:hypothetical protein